MLAQAVWRFMSFNPEENAPGGSPQCLEGHSWWVNGWWQIIHSASCSCASLLLWGSLVESSCLAHEPCHAFLSHILLRLCSGENYTKAPLILMIPLYCHQPFLSQPAPRSLPSFLWISLLTFGCLFSLPLSGWQGSLCSWTSDPCHPELLRDFTSPFR